MSSRSMNIVRIVEFFEQSDLRIARVVVKVCAEIVAERDAQVPTRVSEPSIVRKPRKRKGTGLASAASTAVGLPANPAQESLADA